MAARFSYGTASGSERVQYSSWVHHPRTIVRGSVSIFAAVTRI